MSVFYRLAYRLGVRPWEEAAEHPPAVLQINALLDREQEGRTPPYGKALDLGCGTGIWTVELARRGWDVVGIDIVPTAIEQAQQRVQEAGVEARLVTGSATAMREAGIAEGLRLVWDFGTVHGLTAAQREEVGREVDALAAADATILMLAWKPGRRGPFPRGASRAEILAAFAGWQIVAEERFDATGLPRPLRGVQPRAYRLRRAG